MSARATEECHQEETDASNSNLETPPQPRFRKYEYHSAAALASWKAIQDSSYTTTPSRTPPVPSPPTERVDYTQAGKVEAVDAQTQHLLDRKELQDASDALSSEGKSPVVKDENRGGKMVSPGFGEIPRVKVEEVSSDKVNGEKLRRSMQRYRSADFYTCRG